MRAWRLTMRFFEPALQVLVAAAEGTVTELVMVLAAETAGDDSAATADEVDAGAADEAEPEAPAAGDVLSVELASGDATLETGPPGKTYCTPGL